MQYFIHIVCLFLFGVSLAVDEDTYAFVPFTPPPDCPKNEMFKYCLQNCSNCDERGICPVKDCSRKGCDCLPHFVRLTPGGLCEPIFKCPVAECGENEVFRECGPMCEKCSQLNCRVLHCEHKCYCKEGYKRDDSGKCIPEEECPPKSRCRSNEEMRDSGPIDDFCLRSEDTTNSTQEKTQCYCKEGNKRNSMGHCFNEEYCSIVHCLNDETYQTCPRKCNTTCRNYGDPNCVEDGQCYPGCFCPEGYYMNDLRFCKKLEECPPGSNPFAPTAAPEIETTLPSSVTSETPENEGSTTPASFTVSESTQAESDDEDFEDLPENLPDEDIVSDKKESISTPAPETEKTAGTESPSDEEKLEENE